MAPAVLIQDWPSDLPLRRQTEAQRRRFRLACDLPSKPVKGWGPATLVHLETALSIWRLAPIWRPLVHSKIWGATLSIFISRVGQTGLVWIVSARLSPPRNGETHLPLILRIFWVSPPRLRGYRIRSSRQRSQRLHLGCHGTGEANDPVKVLGCVPRHSTTVPAVDELSHLLVWIKATKLRGPKAQQGGGYLPTGFCHNFFYGPSLSPRLHPLSTGEA